MLLYYITDRKQFAGDETARRSALLRKIEEAARAGVNFIQLREKDLSGRDLEILATKAAHLLRTCCAIEDRPKTRLLINSRADVAIACGANGVHLPAGDISASDIRALWQRKPPSAVYRDGEEKRPVISVACHSSSDVARAAAEAVDFAILAPIFEKKNAPGAEPVGLSGLREACRQKIPIMALGGITLENAHACCEAGAAGIAGIRLFQENNIAAVLNTLRLSFRA